MALAALVLLALMSGRRTSASSSGRPATGHAWVHPLPNLVLRDGSFYRPVVSDPYGWHRKDAEGKPRLHAGADLLWQRKRRGDLSTYAPPRDGTPGYFAPPGIMVMAAAAGRIVSAKRTERGYGIVLAHTGRGVWTFYQHLDQPARDWKVGDEVALGQDLGTMGYDPSGTAVRHLHFERWVWDSAAKKRGKVNPGPELATWPVIRSVVIG